MLKEIEEFLFCDIMPSIPVPRTPGEAVAVLLTLWILLLIFNIFLFNTGINTTMNILLISLIAITIIGYFLGKRYFKNRK